MNPLPQMMPSQTGGASAATMPSRESIDAQAVAALKSEVQTWNAQKLPPVEMAIGALEFLATESKEGFRHALDAPPAPLRGEGRRSTAFVRSVPEMVEAALQRGAPFHFSLHMDPKLIELGNQMSRGWQRLPAARKSLNTPSVPPSPPPAHFKKLVEGLREGDGVVLHLPSNDLLLMARARGGHLIAVARDELASASGGNSSKVYEGPLAQERFDRACHMPGRQGWAMLSLQ